MPLGFEYGRVVPAREKMAEPLMAAVELPRVAAIETVKPSTEICLRRLDEKVVMGIHEAVCVADPVALANFDGEPLDQHVAVHVVPEETLGRVRTGGQMVETSADLDSGWA